MTERSEKDRERSRNVTRILDESCSGELQSGQDLLPLVYEELRSLARARLARQRGEQTLQATGLVHEAFLRLVGEKDPGWNGRRHFFGAAALAMRRILVEQARRKGRVKHGGNRDRVDMEDADLSILPPHEDILALDEALTTLEKKDPRKGKIVNLRYFAGFTAEETAQALQLSLGTVEREWRFIKAWLQEKLGDGDSR